MSRIEFGQLTPDRFKLGLIFPDGPVPLQADDEDDSVDHVAKGAAMLAVFHANAARTPLPDVVSVEQSFAIDICDPETGEVLEEKLVGAFDHRTLHGHRHDDEHLPQHPVPRHRVVP